MRKKCVTGHTELSEHYHFSSPSDEDHFVDSLHIPKKKVRKQDITTREAMSVRTKRVCGHPGSSYIVCQEPRLSRKEVVKESS